MTNYKIYDKITNMNMKNDKMLKTAFIVAILMVACFFGGILLSTTGKVANAAPIQTTKQTLLLPQTEREYFSFNDLQNSAFYWNDNYAVITNNQSDSTQNALWISQKPSEFIKYEGLVVKNPHQVNYCSNNYLLVLDNDNLYTVNLSNLLETATQVFFNQEPVSGRCFDVNNDYIATVSGTAIIIYKHSGHVITEKIVTLPLAKDLTPFCLDDEDNLYYINYDNKIMVYSISAETVNQVYDLQGSTVTSIISNDNYIYFLTSANSVSQINVTTKEKTVLTTDSDFDLGNINNPTNIAFKNENLLITDKNGIQEFSIKDDELIFTGYAIANGKTAFNRVGENAKDVEQYGDVVAILDDYKLTVINTKDFDAYSPDSFINMFCGEAPEMFTLGDGKVLTVNSGRVTLTRLSDQTTVFNELIDGIKDVCYQSGKYYVLKCDRINSSVLPITENGTSLTAIEFENEESNSICVDVLGNVFLHNDGKKYLSDLIASIFETDGASFKVCGNTDYKETMKDDVRSFSMCFDKKEMYFISDASGFVYQTKSVINTAISALEVPEGYLVPLSSAKKSDIKIYELTNDDANLYSIKDDGTGYFEFVKFMSKENAYCLLYELNVSLNAKMLILAGVNGVVLVNNVQTQEQTVEYSESPQKVFATTGVYLYYLPLITLNGEYRLKTDQSFVRVEKGSFLTLDGDSKIQFSDKEFYFASFYSNGETKSGFVPVAFTVEILSKDHVFSNFTHEKVSATKLYLDKSLSSEICAISDDQTVRLFSRGENVSSVAVKLNGEWVTGYIKTSAIKNTPNVAVRNILIILGVLACVCGTATFFLVRKKR